MRRNSIRNEGEMMDEDLKTDFLEIYILLGEIAYTINELIEKYEEKYEVK